MSEVEVVEPKPSTCCPFCNSRSSHQSSDPDQLWIWTQKWENYREAVWISTTMYKFHCYRHIGTVPGNKRTPGRSFLRLRYACRCYECGGEYDLILGGSYH